MPKIVRILTFMSMINVNLEAGCGSGLLIRIAEVMNAADNNLRDNFLKDNA